MKNINIRTSLPEDLHRKVKVVAAQNGINMPEAIAMLLQKYFEMSEEHEKDRT